VLFSDHQIRALVAYVASLGHGPAIPKPHPERGNLSDGLKAFTEYCAGCHQVVAEGGIVTGARVPPLEDATPVQIAEAVRIGPYLMPRFSKRQISDAELDSIIRYVQYAKHPRDEGGWAIGHLGPFPEGMVTWLIGGTLLVGLCVLIGRRVRQ
jgi:quinol---cytochrome-c reductase cytochrome c subunit